ncbi:MAG: DUF5685 family protein [archaeon]|nr:DUF5685 family protein [archaeon]
MFGYIIPIESELSPSQKVTYRNYYCETCHHLKEKYGYMSTLTVNYEMTFATLFFDSIFHNNELFHKQKKTRFCIFGHSICDEKLMHELAAYTVLAINNSLIDDKEDNTHLLKAKLALLCLNRAIVKAKTEFPEYDILILDGYKKLIEAESAKESDPLIMGTYSTQSMLDVFSLMLGAKFSNRLYKLFKNLGIWIYIMDAIEDLDEDASRDTYNPFLINNTNFQSKRQFISDNAFTIGELVGDVTNAIQKSYLSLRSNLKSNTEILDNIIFRGVPFSSHKIICGDASPNLSLKQRINEAFSATVQSNP